jgi:hypothetical protein
MVLRFNSNFEIIGSGKPRRPKPTKRTKRANKTLTPTERKQAIKMIQERTGLSKREASKMATQLNKQAHISGGNLWDDIKNGLANVAKSVVGAIPGVGAFAKEGIDALQHHRAYDIGKAGKEALVDTAFSFIPGSSMLKGLAKSGVKMLLNDKGKPVRVLTQAEKDAIEKARREAEHAQNVARHAEHLKTVAQPTRDFHVKRDAQDTQAHTDGAKKQQASVKARANSKKMADQWKALQAKSTTGGCGTCAYCGGAQTRFGKKNLMEMEVIDEEDVQPVKKTRKPRKKPVAMKRNTRTFSEPAPKPRTQYTVARCSGMSKRGAIVRRIMKEHGMLMKDASHYVRIHGLYDSSATTKKKNARKYRDD